MDKRKNISHPFTMIFSTCNEYSCIWEGFFRSLEEYWPSFNEPIISTASKEIKYHYYSIKPTLTKSSSFSSRLICALKQIKTEIVLLVLDDFYLTKRVDVSFINHALNLMKNNKRIKCINLHEEKPDSLVFKKIFDDCFIVKNNKYEWSATTQASFWDRKYLLRLLHKGETAWDFEIIGSMRNKFYNPLILYRRDLYADSFYYPRGGIVEAGKWREDKEVLPLLMKYDLISKSLRVNDKCDEFKYHNHKKTLFGRIYRFTYRYLSVLIPFLPYFGNNV